MPEFKRLSRPDWSVLRTGTGRVIGVAVVAASVALALWASPSNVDAQGTLPLPTPGTTPAPTEGAPEAPPADVPGVPGEDAKARAAAMAAKANIDITDAWTRQTPNSATTAPIYLHLVSAKDPDRLIGLEVSNAQRIDVRDPGEQGPAKGTAAPSVDVPAGATVEFEPGGRYLLLTGLKAPLKEGESFLLTFRFDKGGTQTAVVKVLGTNAAGPPQTATERSGDTTAGATDR
jgi:copper(I)-binding protein